MSRAWVTSSECCEDTTMVSTSTGRPSSYLIVTWLLASGLRKSRCLFFLTSASFMAILCARSMGSGMNSGVWSQA